MNGRRVLLGWLLLAALSLHAWAMGPQNLPHMVWSCHVASTVLAVGLLLNKRVPVSAGFLFHLALGFPAWLTEIVLTRGAFGAPVVTPRVLATSTMVHLLPLLCGLFYLRRSSLPLPSLVLAWLLQVGMVPLSRWLTPAELNVNLSHVVWGPLAGAFSNFWLFQSAAALATLLALSLVRALWNRFVAPLHFNRPLPHPG